VPAIPLVTEAGRPLCRQAKRWRASFFTVLADRAVPPTNNASERAFRPSVIVRKVTNGFRSAWDAATHTDVRCVIGTGRLDGISPHETLSRAITGQPIFATGPAPSAITKCQA